MIPGPELAAIAAVCRERGIRILSDETYHGITYGARADSILAHAPDAVVVNTFSKYWCMTGWRLGWAVVPATLVDPMRRFAGNLFLVPPTLSQHVALAAMDAHADLEAHVATYAKNRALLSAALAGFGIHRIAPPDGAFYLYADVGDLTRRLARLVPRDPRCHGRCAQYRPGLRRRPGRPLRAHFVCRVDGRDAAGDRAARWLVAQAQARMTRVLFVCIGNICRSPTAEAVLREIARRESPGLVLEVDSAGTHGYHTGSPPDERSTLAARRRGYRPARAARPRRRARRLRPVRPRDRDGRRGLRPSCRRSSRKRTRRGLRCSWNLRRRSAVATCPIRTTAARRASKTCWTWWKRARAACSLPAK